MVLLLIITLSVRMLSDPDLGTHLSGGRWIAEHHTVPHKDFSTYTVTDHRYIDIYWVFQLLVYGMYSLGGYAGLSLLVTTLSLILFLLLSYRNQNEKIPTGIGIFLLMFAFLVIEPRLILRPELFTYIFIVCLVFILDLYNSRQKDLLFLLPFIMLVWCNMQGLFVLGLGIIVIYFAGKFISDRKPDYRLGLILLASVLACLVNPYFYRGFLLPFELFSRLEGENIFHQHIRELSSFASPDRMFFKDFLFLAWSLLCFISFLFSWRMRKVHEGLLMLVFFYLAVISVRNIPLFVVISIPVAGRSLNDIRTGLAGKMNGKLIPAARKLAWWLCILIPVLLIPRLLTNSYYRENQSNSKTGLGIDKWYQPVRVADFIKDNYLNVRFVNSLAFGGWLGWSLQQPVFIDGRLEVMKDELYTEVVNSWDGKLPALLSKYKPGLIVYNYLKYYPWTVQLKTMTHWQLVYADGFSAVFAEDGLAGGTPGLIRLDSVMVSGLMNKDVVKIRETLLRKPFTTAMKSWLWGYYRPFDYANEETLNKASLMFQLGLYEAAEMLFLQYLDKADGQNFTVFYALADIYRYIGTNDLARICCNRILEVDQKDAAAIRTIEELDKAPPFSPPAGIKQTSEPDAVSSFNRGNDYFRNGLPDKALEAYNEALKISPGYIKALNNRGILLASSFRRYKEAIADFSEVIKIDPANADACLGRGSCYFQLNETGKACKDWEKAFGLGKQEAGVLLQQHCGSQRK